MRFLRSGEQGHLSSEEIRVRVCETLRSHGVDYTLGIIEFLRLYSLRVGVNPEELKHVDVLVHESDYERASSMMHGLDNVVIEITALPNLQERCFYVRGLPYPSVEDLMIAVAYNLDKEWYVRYARMIAKSFKHIDWSFIRTVCKRLGVLEVLERALS